MLLCILGCALSGCRPRQAAPTGMAVRLPDAPVLSTIAHEFSSNEIEDAAAPAGAPAGTGAYGLAVTVGTVAMARVTAPAFAAAPGLVVPVRVAGTSERFGMAAGLAVTRRMTAREALRDRDVRMRRAIARYGTADTSPRAQKEPVLMDDSRGPAPARAAQPQ